MSLSNDDDAIVTEREVRRGIRDKCPTTPEHHCLAYIRHIEHMNLCDVRAARNFVHMTPDSSVDTEAEHWLSTLRDEFVPRQLSSSNVRHFTVQWKSPDGLDIISHDDYLNNFCNTFYSLVQYSILFSCASQMFVYCKVSLR